MLQVYVKGLMFDPYNHTYIVVLRDESNKETIPIWVGKAEANAISLALEGVSPPRPMTHDFIKNVLDLLEAKVISIVVTDIQENTYYAKIHLGYRDSEFTIDARPSDALALALRTEAPIFAAQEVVEKQNSEALAQWLDSLKPEDFGQSDD